MKDPVTTTPSHQPKIWTRQDLDAARCGTPGCTANHDVVVLHGECHPRSTQIVRFHRETGAIEITCKVCNRFIGMIALDPRDAETLLARLPPGEDTLRLHPHCGPRCRKVNSLFITYGDGHLSAICARCKRVFSVLHVKDVEALDS